MANVFDHPPRLAFPIYELVLFSQKIHFCVRFTRIVKGSVSQIFGPYLRIFFSGITQRPVLQEKGPPRRAGVLQIGPEVERIR